MASVRIFTSLPSGRINSFINAISANYMAYMVVRRSPNTPNGNVIASGREYYQPTSLFSLDLILWF